MGTVLAMLHAGRRCAIPARQVVLAEIGDSAGDDVPLWATAGEAATTPAQRTVRVSTGGALRSIACARPRLVELDRERVWPLPELLVDVLAMPYVVGVAEIEGVLHWVIDARHLPTGTGTT